MIKNLKNNAIAAGVLLASTLAVPANASGQKQIGWWGNTDLATAIVDAAEMRMTYDYRANPEVISMSFKDGRGVGLNPYMQLSGDVVGQLGETTPYIQASMDGRGVGLQTFRVAYTSLNDSMTVGNLAVKGWKGNVVLDEKTNGYMRYSPTYDAGVSYSSAIMRDGRGVGLQQASLTSDFVVPIALAAVATSGNF